MSKDAVFSFQKNIPPFLMFGLGGTAVFSKNLYRLPTKIPLNLPTFVLKYI
jgi:hypothetical protein